jgi:hypothetical protein
VLRIYPACVTALITALRKRIVGGRARHTKQHTAKIPIVTRVLLRTTAISREHEGELKFLSKPFFFFYKIKHPYIMHVVDEASWGKKFKNNVIKRYRAPLRVHQPDLDDKIIKSI